jgi:hypothetical protein
VVTGTQLTNSSTGLRPQLRRCTALTAAESASEAAKKIGHMHVKPPLVRARMELIARAGSYRAIVRPTFLKTPKSRVAYVCLFCA